MFMGLDVSMAWCGIQLSFWNISDSLTPLQEMTRKNAKFNRSHQCEEVFSDIKLKIGEAIKQELAVC